MQTAYQLPAAKGATCTLQFRHSRASTSSTPSSLSGFCIASAANAADAVLIGSGKLTREIVADAAIMSSLRLDPSRQLLAAQCSGIFILAKLGLLDGVPACTDLITKAWVEEAGVHVLNQPFYAKGRVATAGGCLAAQYLAAWLIANLVGADAARAALHYVAPVGEKGEYVGRAMRNIEPYLLPREAAA